MTEDERTNAHDLLKRIEVAAGEIAPRDTPNAEPLADILQAVNGLRAILGIPWTR